MCVDSMETTSEEQNDKKRLKELLDQFDADTIRKLLSEGDENLGASGTVTLSVYDDDGNVKEEVEHDIDVEVNEVL